MCKNFICPCSHDSLDDYNRGGGGSRSVQQYHGSYGGHTASAAGDGLRRATARLLDESTMSRMRANYWTAKQTIRSRLGKKEDDHLVASDAELDSKLAVYYSLKDTCDAMILCIENYQDAICGRRSWIHLFDHIERHLSQNCRKRRTRWVDF